MRLLALVTFVTAAALAQTPPTPSINTGGVVNPAASPSVQAIAPGSLVSIFGSNLASSMTLFDSVPLSSNPVGGVSVTIGGFPAPVQFVGPNQVNVQAPWEVPTSDSAGPAQVVITNGAGSASTTVTVASSAPALYAIGSQAIAVNSDGTLAAPANSIPGIPTRPAVIGDAKGLVLFATGMGPVDVPLADGANSSDQTRNTLAQPAVLIGGVPAQVTYSGLSTQFVGVNQINVVIAAGTPTGDAVPVQIQVNGSTNSNFVTISVSN